jgi:hypothetical protein
MIHVIGDNFQKIHGFSHKKLREEITSKNIGIYKWL